MVGADYHRTHHRRFPDSRDSRPRVLELAGGQSSPHRIDGIKTIHLINQQQKKETEWNTHIR